MASFLFFGISCQKQELEITKEKTQEIVYSLNLDGSQEDEVQVLGASQAQFCKCSLNARANVNTTNFSGSSNDWKAQARFRTSTNPTTWQTIAQFGQGQTAYTGSDNTIGGQLGFNQGIPFTPPSNSFQLVISIPGNDDWDPATVRASVTCSYANQSGGVSFTHNGGGSPLRIEEGAISSCSVYPSASGGM